jgi:dienelactone hydrolase
MVGLVDHIKDLAERFSHAGFLASLPILYGEKTRVRTTPAS